MVALVQPAPEGRREEDLRGPEGDVSSDILFSPCSPLVMAIPRHTTRLLLQLLLPRRILSGILVSYALLYLMQTGTRIQDFGVCLVVT